MPRSVSDLFDALFCRVFLAIVLSGTAAGHKSSLSTDYIKAKKAAGRLFAIIDRQPKIDVDQTDGKQLVGPQTSSCFVSGRSWYLP